MVDKGATGLFKVVVRNDSERQRASHVVEITRPAALERSAAPEIGTPALAMAA